MIEMCRIGATVFLTGFKRIHFLNLNVELMFCCGRPNVFNLISFTMGVDFVDQMLTKLILQRFNAFVILLLTCASFSKRTITREPLPRMHQEAQSGGRCCHSHPDSRLEEIRDDCGQFQIFLKGAPFYIWDLIFRVDMSYIHRVQLSSKHTITSRWLEWPKAHIFLLAAIEHLWSSLLLRTLTRGSTGGMLRALNAFAEETSLLPKRTEKDRKASLVMVFTE